jgi:hypothetical protein
MKQRRKKMPEINQSNLARIEVLVEREIHKAMEKHESMHSPHEAYAVILEELDEFWEEVKKQKPSNANMRVELTQVAAMAMRAIHNLKLLEDA